jgi:hypothetical protein
MAGLAKRCFRMRITAESKVCETGEGIVHPVCGCVNCHPPGGVWERDK